MPELQLIATCAFGLEAVVIRELADLGYEGRGLRTGAVEFNGDAAAVCRANLWLRSADRVLIRMGAFPATDFGQLFDQTSSLPWEEWIPPQAAFPVKGRSLKSQLSSVPACQKIVKKALVEKLKSAHRVPALDETGPTMSVEVALLKDEATLTLDTTGPSLHKRGYRRLVADATLKETLAAAMVMLSFWRPERPLWDPFCGVGTIPIEAALIGRRIAPGLTRSFAAEEWPTFDSNLWTAAREQARDVQQPALEERIHGTDHDGRVLSMARHHAHEAGVDADIHFQQKDFADIRSSREHGCLITNPPYGERLSHDREIEALYRSMPDIFRRLPTWSHYILSARDDFERLVGQQADRRRKLYNGRIRCTLYQYHGPKPEEVKAARKRRPEGEDGPDERVVPSAPSPPAKPQPAFGGLTPKAREQAELFRARLKKRAHHLRRWPTRQGITCYRLYERDIPEIPLVVDRYEDFLHVAEFDRPHERTPAEHGDWLDLMCRTAAETLDLPPENVLLKRRERQRGDAQYTRQSEQQRTAVVSEGGLKFEINLTDYIDVGLFLDHRQTRAMVRDEAAGKRVLNLFCYTGSFTVYAAAGGAESSVSVDRSSTYLRWAERNMQLNNLAGPEHRFVEDDVMPFLRRQPRGEAFDLAIVDPPTFSNAKDAEDFDVQQDHAELLTGVLDLLSPGGVVYFSTNFRRFKFAEEEIPAQAIEITRQTIPPDFRNRRIHRCWKLVRPDASKAS